jgi:type IV fimbrial biogenesis protein FimT
MVVVTMIALLMAIAVPSMSGVLARYHLRDAARTVYGDLHLARLSAIKEGSQCTVSFDGAGYNIFIDINGNFAVDTGDVVIKSVQWSNFTDVSYSGTTFPGDKVGFLPDSRTVATGGGFGAGTVMLSGSNGDQLSVVMNITGSVRIQ